MKVKDLTRQDSGRRSKQARRREIKKEREKERKRKRKRKGRKLADMNR